MIWCNFTRLALQVFKFLGSALGSLTRWSCNEKHHVYRSSLCKKETQGHKFYKQTIECWKNLCRKETCWCTGIDSIVKQSGFHEVSILIFVGGSKVLIMLITIWLQKGLMYFLFRELSYAQKFPFQIWIWVLCYIYEMEPVRNWMFSDLNMSSMLYLWNGASEKLNVLLLVNGPLVADGIINM